MATEKTPDILQLLLQTFNTDRQNFPSSIHDIKRTNKEREKAVEEAYLKLGAFFDDVLYAMEHANADVRVIYSLPNQQNAPANTPNDASLTFLKIIKRNKILEEKIKRLQELEKTDRALFENKLKLVSAEYVKKNFISNAILQNKKIENLGEFHEKISNTFLHDIIFNTALYYEDLLAKNPGFSTRPSDANLADAKVDAIGSLPHADWSKYQLQLLYGYAEQGNFQLVILKALRNIEEIQIDLMQNQLRGNAKRKAETEAKQVIAQYKKCINVASQLFKKNQDRTIQTDLDKNKKNLEDLIKENLFHLQRVFLNIPGHGKLDVTNENLLDPIKLKLILERIKNILRAPLEIKDFDIW